MRPELFDILRCPFCGGRLHPLGNLHRDASGAVLHGVLACACCAYPVVDGVPVMRTSHVASQAIKDLEAGDHRRALLTVLDVDREERRAAFAAMLDADVPPTFARAIEALLPDGEGLYYLHRFSDPTFFVSQAVARALAQDPACFVSRPVDVCGGCGHLARVLGELSGRRGGPRALLTDASYWRLWLARRFVAPDADAVCCDANAPLPFAPDCCSLAVCSDAFHYVWCKRLLADELVRLTGDLGTVVLAHVHSAHGDNQTAGQTLEPEHYRALLPGRRATLFADGTLLREAHASKAVDLSREATAPELQGEPSITIVASRRGELFRRHHLLAPRLHPRDLRINPLYEVMTDGAERVLRLRFPTLEYEREFGRVTDHLPAEVRVAAAVLDNPSRLLVERPDLVDRLVVLPLPSGYL